MTMHFLCVAEKPSIAKSLSQLLSPGTARSRPGRHKYCRNFDLAFKYPMAVLAALPLPRPLTSRAPFIDCSVTVTSVLGHLLDTDFADPHVNTKWHSCPPEELFHADVRRGVNGARQDGDMVKVKQNLEAEARQADVLVIWTDCDREGENIGLEIVQVCRAVNPRLLVKRARFSVIQQREIQHAMLNLIDLDLRQAAAVDVRTELDLRIGAALTRFLSLRFQPKFTDLQDSVISYGSCQFPTLGFVVDVYNKVAAFIPEPFWKIHVSVTRPSNLSAGTPIHCAFHWMRDRLFDELLCTTLFEACVTSPLATVTGVDTKPRSRWKPLPLTTVELQKMGTRYLRMSSDRVMAIAERLYQQGLVSYPRTETNEFEPAMELLGLVRLQVNDPAWGAWVRANLVEGGMFERPRSGGKNDKAHPPIHPTKAAPPQGLSAEERKVYEFIARRFLAACARDAKGSETKATIEIAGESFTASGLVVLERNYLDVYPYDKWMGNEIPHFTLGEQFVPTECLMQAGETSPPSLLTEADLIGLMDANGIGTDATIHEHIKKVMDRKYVFKQGTHLVPSTLGIALVEGMDRVTLQSLAKPHLRAEMERELVEICEGRVEPAVVVRRAVDKYREVYRRTVVRAWVIEGVLSDKLGVTAREGLLGMGRGNGGGPPPPPRRGGGIGRGVGRGNGHQPPPPPPAGAGFGAGPRNGGPPPPPGGAAFGYGGALPPQPVPGFGAPPRPGRALPGPPPPPHNGNSWVQRPLAPGPTVSRFGFGGPPPMPQGDFKPTLAPPPARLAHGSNTAPAGTMYTSRSHSADSSTTSFTSGPSAQPSAPAAIKCLCDLHAKPLTAGPSSKNPGRQFYKCPNESQQCSFFAWADETGVPVPAQIAYGDEGGRSRGRGRRGGRNTSASSSGIRPVGRAGKARTGGGGRGRGRSRGGSARGGGRGRGRQGRGSGGTGVWEEVGSADEGNEYEY